MNGIINFYLTAVFVTLFAIAVIILVKLYVDNKAIKWTVITVTTLAYITLVGIFMFSKRRIETMHSLGGMPNTGKTYTMAIKKGKAGIDTLNNEKATLSKAVEEELAKKVGAEKAELRRAVEKEQLKNFPVDRRKELKRWVRLTGSANTALGKSQDIMSHLRDHGPKTKIMIGSMMGLVVIVAVSAAFM